MWRAEASAGCRGPSPQERSRDYSRVEDAKVMMLGSALKSLGEANSWGLLKLHHDDLFWYILIVAFFFAKWIRIIRQADGGIQSWAHSHKDQQRHSDIALCKGRARHTVAVIRGFVSPSLSILVSILVLHGPEEMSAVSKRPRLWSGQTSCGPLLWRIRGLRSDGGIIWDHMIWVWNEPEHTTYHHCIDIDTDHIYNSLMGTMMIKQLIMCWLGIRANFGKPYFAGPCFGIWFLFHDF